MSTAPQTPRAEIVVDLGAFRENLTRLGELVATETDGPALMVVVKADAYGHGMLECARAAREFGVPWLGVATQDEALALRADGDAGRLLCWLGVPGEDYRDAVAADIDLSASSVGQLAEIVAGAGAADRTARVHLKVDTGLSRNGASRADWSELFDAAAAAQEAGSIAVVGIWSHLACADQPTHPANDRQVEAFTEALELAAERGLEPEVRHLANSAGALLRPDTWFDLVRFGIAAYGLSPAPSVVTADDLGLEPMMAVTARAALVKELAPGDGVSYGHTFKADRGMRVALVPLGYGDGVPRHASATAEVQVDGVRGTVLGRICMDQFVVAVPDDFEVGDQVVLFGAGDLDEPTAQEWADWCGTISYEIVTRIGGTAGRAARRWIR